MQDDWLDADETAASLQITKATLYKLIRAGVLPARKVRGKWRVSRTSLEDLFVGATPGVGPEREASR